MEIIIGVVSVVLTAVGALIAYLQLRRSPQLPSRPSHSTVSEAQNALPPSKAAPMHNLPPRELFIGRQKEKKRVLDGLASSYPVLAVEGLGGMGKTALAKETAWLCTHVQAREPSDEPPQYEAIIWIDGQDGHLSLNDMLDAIAGVLDYRFIVSLSLEEKTAEINKQLRTKACLIIVDNFETVLDVGVGEFIARIPEPPSKALVTTRERLLRGAWAIDIGKMEQKDAFTMIENEGKRLGLRYLENADSNTLAAIYDATGGNPLAIRLSLGMLRNSGLSLDEILERLTSADDDELFEVLFKRDWYDLLKDDEPSKAVLMTMALLSRTISRDAVEAGSDVHHAYLRTSIKRLIELSLVDVSDGHGNAPQRLHMHSLTRVFVRKELASREDMETVIKNRLVEYFLAYAEARANTYASEVSVRELELERHNIIQFAGLAAEHSRACDERNLHEIVIRYSTAMSSFLWGRGYWNDKLKLCEDAIEACRRLNDPISLASQLCAKGRIYLWRGNVAIAQQCAEESKVAIGQFKDGAVWSITLRLEAQIATRLGDYDRAEILLGQVLEFAPMTVDDNGQAATLIELGIIAEKQSKLKVARERFTQALKLDEQLETVEGQAVTLSHLANIVLSLGEVDEAKRLFERGLELANQVNRISTAGRCQVGLARISLLQKDREAALPVAEAARENFTKLGMTDMVDEAREVASLATGDFERETDLARRDQSETQGQR